MSPLPALVALCALPALAAEVRFVPEPVEAVQGQPLVLKGRFEPPGQVQRARVRLRLQGEAVFAPVDLVLVDEKTDTWEAHIDGNDVATPGLEYFVVAQLKSGKAAPVLGSNHEPVILPVVTAAPQEVNPLETAEERELRTGERAGGSTLGGTSLRRTRPQAADLRVEDVSATSTTALAEDFRVFAAEDATAIAATYAQSVRTAPAIITVISRARIEESGARSLLDILKEVPGFEVSRSIFGFDEVSIRGIRTDPEILLLVDGHRVANLYDGRNPWAVPADIIERVEVIRGPGSALYGTGAFLGVVNVVTREHEFVRARAGMSLLKPSPALFTDGRYGLPRADNVKLYDPAHRGDILVENDLGAAGLFAPEASLSGGVNRFGLRAFGSGYARVSRGQRSLVATDAASDTGLLRDPLTMQTDSREARAAFSGKVDYAPPFLRGGHGFARTFFQYEDRGPYFGVYDTLGPRSQLAWILGTLDTGYAQPFGDGGEVLGRLYADGHMVDRRLQFSPDGFSTNDRNGDGQREVFPQGVLARTTYLTNALGAEGRLVLPALFRHRLATGVQLELDAMPFYRFTLNRDGKGAYLDSLVRPQDIAQPQDGAWRITAAAFAQDEWRVTDRLFATVGMRVNTIHDFVADSYKNGARWAEGFRADPWHAIPWDPRTHITPRAAVVFEPIDDLAFKALYGAAFRAPTFEEKYDQTSSSYADFSPGVFKGSTRLEPEYIHTAEMGADYATTLGAFRYRVAANGFYSFIGNSIDRIDQSGTQEEIANRGFRHITGVEGEGRIEFAPRTYVYANVSWFRGWFVEPDPQAAPRLDWLRPLTYVDSVRGFPNTPEKTDISYLTVVPQARANVGASVELFELVDLHADLRLGAERRNNVRSTLERLRVFRIPAYVVVNAGFRTRPILGWFGLEGNLYNALDQDYRDDVPRPDRVKELLPRDGMTALLGVYLQH
ncbi:MAG: TonB-dependent receptor [Deltaproteobacteria bacterium]|nr:TonB-dependent receptor [Deltaproteobacteria bacterium]